MNVDYKIFTKIIALRLQEVMGSIIHRDQSGFMKGRYIGENLIELLSTIEYCKKNIKSVHLYLFLILRRPLIRWNGRFLMGFWSFLIWGKILEIG